MAPNDLPSDGDTVRRRSARSVLPSAKGRTRKRPENTVQGCRDRATADLLEAVTVVTANQRRRLERSAESWTVRATLLDRLNKSFEKRAAIDRENKHYEVDHVRL